MFSKKLREDSPNLHFHAASASHSAWRVPRAQRGECLALSAPLERRLCIFTQLNGASKQGKTATSNQHSHSHLTAKHQTHLWQDSCLFQLNRTARQNADSHLSQNNTAIFTPHSQTPNAPLEKQLFISTQPNSASKQR